MPRWPRRFGPWFARCWQNPKPRSATGAGSLRDALGVNGQLIVNLIPELELLIGPQPKVANLPPLEERSRFQMLFRRFLGVFAQPDQPLVVFLDDLQWLDPATLDLMTHLVTHPEVRHLMLVAASRDNDAGPPNRLAQALAEIRNTRPRLDHIVLAPLDRADIGQLVADSLRCGYDSAASLVRLIQQQTGGNPFFAIQFLTALTEEGLLTFDPGRAAWTWDLPGIRAKGFTDNVADLMATKLGRLPGATRTALAQLACLGHAAAFDTLALVQGDTQDAVRAALWPALQAGLVSHGNGAYAFAHDRIQEAAYAQLPDAERAALHLQIGRLLAARAESDRHDDDIFDIVNQFNRGLAPDRNPAGA